jgi:hypothetical protein
MGDVDVDVDQGDSTNKMLMIKLSEAKRSQVRCYLRLYTL